MKHALILIAFFAACGVNSNEKVASQEDPVKSRTEDNVAESDRLEASDQNQGVAPEQLLGTIWISEVAPTCVDTLAFKSETEGQEYRCEFQLHSRFTYSFQSDTLRMDEYGLVSEVDASLGEEIKYQWTYLLAGDELRLVGQHELTYKLLK